MTKFISTPLAKTLAKISVLLLTTATLGSLAACGQKGPLIIEQPPEEQVTTQKEEPAETK